MDITSISKARLHSQQIAKPVFNKITDLVSYMGAIQAQDHSMSKWAVGVRIPGIDEKAVEAAISKGDIIRTHVLRPTWHLAAAADIRWMLKLSAGRIKASARSRLKELELSDAVLKKCNKILEKKLAEAHHTREELTKLFAKEKIDTSANRLSHIMMNAELEGLVCSGEIKGNKQTYALLDERVPAGKEFTKEEAYAELAKRYFTSHGPATVHDFSWWSGLSLTEARQGLEMVRHELVSIEEDAVVWWMKEPLIKKKSSQDHAWLLPAYDEFIISYKNKTASLAIDHHAKAITENGLFRPVIVVNGVVTGIWKREIKKDKVLIEMTFFTKPSKEEKKEILKAAKYFADFAGKELVLDL
jgi:hypothetical protein